MDWRRESLFESGLKEAPGTISTSGHRWPSRWSSGKAGGRLRVAGACSVGTRAPATPARDVAPAHLPPCHQTRQDSRGRVLALS